MSNDLSSVILRVWPCIIVISAQALKFDQMGDDGSI